MKRFFIALLILLGIYFAWSFNGRSVNVPANYKPLAQIQHLNTQNGSANIIGIQPFMSTLDYSGAGAFSDKLEFYLTALEKNGFINEGTTILLPEHFGTWLVAAEEKESVYESETIDSAIRLAALSNIFQFAYYYLQSEARNKARETIFRMKGSKMATIYSFTLSNAAKKFRVHIIGGSIVLPDPSVAEGKLVLGDGPLKNVTMVFTPDGSINDLLYSKKYPSSTEREFVGVSLDTWTPYELPFGRGSILIGEDAWHQVIYDQMREQETSVVLVPSFLSGNEVWNGKWQGIEPMPSDIPDTDINKISESEAWHNYAIQRIGNGVGMAIFLRGDLWNLGTQGSSFGYINNEVIVGETTTEPKALITWF